MTTDDLNRIDKHIEAKYYLVTKKQWLAFLGGAVGLLIAVFAVSWASVKAAFEQQAVADAAAKIERLAAEMEKRNEQSKIAFDSIEQRATGSVVDSEGKPMKLIIGRTPIDSLQGARQVSVVWHGRFAPPGAPKDSWMISGLSSGEGPLHQITGTQPEGDGSYTVGIRHVADPTPAQSAKSGSIQWMVAVPAR